MDKWKHSLMLEDLVITTSIELNYICIVTGLESHLTKTTQRGGTQSTLINSLLTLLYSGILYIQIHIVCIIETYLIAI